MARVQHITLATGSPLFDMLTRPKYRVRGRSATLVIGAHSLESPELLLSDDELRVKAIAHAEKYGALDVTRVAHGEEPEVVWSAE